MTRPKCCEPTACNHIGTAGRQMRHHKKKETMRFIPLTTVLISLAVAPYAIAATPGIVAPNVTVGRNLQTSVSVRLPQAAAESGVEITVSSDDPSRLLLSLAPDRAGSATISLTVQPHFIDSPEFCIQGMADSGTVTYTVSAGNMGTAKGTVTLAPSAILILGPTRVPKFPTTPGGAPARIRIVSAALDSSLKVAGEQQVAGGLQLDVTLANSNPAAGKLEVSMLMMGGGLSTATTSFKPAAEGDTTIAPVQPPGFTAPGEFASVTAAVALPGLAPVGEVFLGKDLQMSATLCLGEAAPSGGLKVTLTSADGSRLLLSAKEDELGSPSLTLTVPAGQLTAIYYLQALGDSGVVTYDAAAPGFRSSTARIGLTHSGFIVAYEGYGPPDEAAVRRQTGYSNSREFYASVSDAKVHPMHITVYSVHIDPDTGRAADITVQPLRAGVTATVVLKSSNPTVGTVASPVTIRSGASQVKSLFIPMDTGKTVISVDTPAGFAAPGNATSVPATVSN
jgi:hypothetical protein